MKQIKFSHNWNGKLGLDIFTTIRSFSVAKHGYYCGLIGSNFDVILKGERKCKAILQQVETMLFQDIPEALRMYDTGMPYKNANQLFKSFGIENMDRVIILTFQKDSSKDKLVGGEE